MIRSHRERGADLTIGCIPVPLKDSSGFGVMQVDDEERIIGFQEKPKEAQPMPGDTTHCLGSMGIYVFTARLMYELLCQDATRSDSDHDFGKNIIPTMIQTHKVFSYRFRDKNRKAMPYWRDVGTLDAYYQANLDLIEVDPVLNLYDRDWPIRTYQPQLPPPKFVFRDEGGDTVRRGEAHDSMVCPGCIISGGHVRRSILSPNVRINSYALVENSVLFDGVDVGRHCRIRKAIIDKEVNIPPNTTIGYDLEHDRKRGFMVTEQGVVVIAKAELPETFADKTKLSCCPFRESRVRGSQERDVRRGERAANAAIGIWYFVAALVLVAGVLLFLWLALFIQVQLETSNQLNLDDLRVAAKAAGKRRGQKSYDMVYTVQPRRSSQGRYVLRGQCNAARVQSVILGRQNSRWRRS